MNVLERREMVQMMTDSDALLQVKCGSKEAIEYLMKKYEIVVKQKSRIYFLMGSDRDDVIQEGLIGLYKAICDFDETKRSSFRTFAELCITRQIISSIKSATRLKHTPLNSYVSIHKPIMESETERTLLDCIDNEAAVDPSLYVEYKEQNNEMYYRIMRALTRFEWQVFQLYLQGMTYKETAHLLNRREKAIDNALQRVKKKLDSLVKSKKFTVIQS